MRNYFRSAETKVEFHRNPHRERLESPFPNAQPKERTIEEDLALAEELRNDQQKFFQWWADEGYYYAKFAHIKARTIYDDHENDLADLIFDAWDAIRGYGKRIDGTVPEKIAPLKNFMIFCLKRRLCSLACTWQKKDKKLIFADVEELAWENGIVDTDCEVPEYDMTIFDLVEYCKTLLSELECKVFLGRLRGYGLSEIANELRLDPKVCDNAEQRFSLKLRDNKKAIELYNWMIEVRETMTNHKKVDDSSEIWEWVQWSFKCRNRSKNEENI